MKRVGWLVLIGLLFSCCVYAQNENMYVKVKKENFRSGPSGEKLGEVVSGAKVKVLEKRSNWVKVQFTGWIWEKSLTKDPTEVDGFTVKASHILLETEAEANTVLNGLKAGASFEEFARSKSIDSSSGKNGGDLGEFGRGDLMPEFENVVFRLGVGKLSNVVKTDLGYHIIKRTK